MTQVTPQYDAVELGFIEYPLISDSEANHRHQREMIHLEMLQSYSYYVEGHV